MTHVLCLIYKSGLTGLSFENAYDNHTIIRNIFLYAKVVTLRARSSVGRNLLLRISASLMRLAYLHLPRMRVISRSLFNELPRSIQCTSSNIKQDVFQLMHLLQQVLSRCDHRNTVRIRIINQMECNFEEAKFVNS